RRRSGGAQGGGARRGPRVGGRAGPPQWGAGRHARDAAGEIRRMKSPQARIAGAFRRRPKVNIIVFTLTVLIAVASLQAADLWWRRESVIRNAETRASNLAVVSAAHVRGSFASADAALRQIVIHGKRVGGSSQPDDVWDPILASARAGLNEVGALRGNEQKGIITHSTLHELVGQSREDFYIFRRLASNGVAEPGSSLTRCCHRCLTSAMH